MGAKCITNSKGAALLALQRQLRLITRLMSVPDQHSSSYTVHTNPGDLDNNASVDAKMLNF